MKFKVREKDAKKEPEVEFWLEELNDGGIALRAQCAGGAKWFIATIAKSGVLQRHADIGFDVGLSTDSRGRIELSGGGE